MKKTLTPQELATSLFVKHPEYYGSFNRVRFTGKQLQTVAAEYAKQHLIDIFEDIFFSSFK